MKARPLIALWLAVRPRGRGRNRRPVHGRGLSTATLTCDELDYFTEANRLEARERGAGLQRHEVAGRRVDPESAARAQRRRPAGWF